ncbi:hypothetical protein Gxy13693_010_073 [Komagataeibacter xylinus NBRC 13693]|uniref:Bro-N domain-containing protein n=1 Tax=Komagataeibacter xylinus NBRC 13693 TaxID=1234668 RepID=A0A0D6Q7L8_KOMXY|nr:BRO family protein [Komagataeibacter xylinus]GAN98756.1 hypothetical protein Gxy13693_010_073 [Komagataeibacter xylinus NBRC 13693]
MQKVRVVEIGGTPWFVAHDVCASLGLSYNKHGGTYAHHIQRIRLEDKCKLSVPFISNEGTTSRRTMAAINESGLYMLVMRCRRPDARPFQDWVTRVVLPTLRKEGVYVRDEEKVADASSVEDLDSLNDMIVGLMKRKTELLEARLAEKEAIIQKQAPKVSAYEDMWQFKADILI